MAVTVKKAKLWRKELDNRPGTLAKALAPIAEAGISLKTVMGYRFPGDERKAAVEVWPIEGKKAEDAARKAGLRPFADVPCLIVEGDDRAGLGARISQTLSDNRINIAFVMTLVLGKKYISIMGFDNERDAEKALPLIKRANLTTVSAERKKGAKRKTTVKKAGKAAQRKAVTSKPKKAAAKKTTGAAKKASAKKTTAKKTTSAGRKSKTKKR